MLGYTLTSLRNLVLEVFIVPLRWRPRVKTRHDGWKGYNRYDTGLSAGLVPVGEVRGNGVLGDNISGVCMVGYKHSIWLPLIAAVDTDPVVRSCPHEKREENQRQRLYKEMPHWGCESPFPGILTIGHGLCFG